MTTELKWLVYTAILAGSLWIPYIVGVNVTNFDGTDDLFTRPPDPSKMPAWVHRSLRAQQNLLEQFPPFAAKPSLTSRFASVRSFFTPSP